MQQILLQKVYVLGPLLGRPPVFSATTSHFGGRLLEVRLTYTQVKFYSFKLVVIMVILHCYMTG